MALSIGNIGSYSLVPFCPFPWDPKTVLRISPSSTKPPASEHAYRSDSIGHSCLKSVIMILKHLASSQIPLAAKMLDVRTAIGFALSCQIIRIGPQVYFSPQNSTHLEGVVARGALGNCARHFGELLNHKQTNLKEQNNRNCGVL